MQCGGLGGTFFWGHGSFELKHVRAPTMPMNWEIWPIFAITCGKGREEGKKDMNHLFLPPLL